MEKEKTFEEKYKHLLKDKYKTDAKANSDNAKIFLYKEEVTHVTLQVSKKMKNDLIFLARLDFRILPKFIKMKLEIVIKEARERDELK